MGPVKRTMPPPVENDPQVWGREGQQNAGALLENRLPVIILSREQNARRSYVPGPSL